MEGNGKLVLKGINELEVVGRSEDVYFVQGFLSHHDIKVRRAARITIATLKPEEATFCLINLIDKLDSHEKKCLYKSLKKLSVNQLPDFSVYFDCCSESAICFSIDMAAKFNQTEAIQQIRNFIFHHSKEVSHSAIEALKSLQYGNDWISETMIYKKCL